MQETHIDIAWERGICKYVNDGAALTTSFIMQGNCGGGNLVSGESARNPQSECPLEAFRQNM